MPEQTKLSPNQMLQELQRRVDNFFSLNIEDIRSQIINYCLEIVKSNQDWKDKVSGIVSNAKHKEDTFLHRVVRQGVLADVKKLFSLNIDLTIMNSHKNSLLHSAILNNKTLIIKEIVDSCSREQKAFLINARNKDGVTALHAAVMTDQFAVVVFLLNNGAKSDIKDNKGSTPLDVAEFLGYQKISDVFQGMVDIENFSIEKGVIPPRSQFDRHL